MKMEQTECSETSAYKLQTSGKYSKESIQPTEHGESLKSRIVFRNNTPHTSSGSTLKMEAHFIAKRQHPPTLHGV